MINNNSDPMEVVVRLLELSVIFDIDWGEDEYSDLYACQEWYNHHKELPKKGEPITDLNRLGDTYEKALLREKEINSKLRAEINKLKQAKDKGE